ncbi:Prephenate dehydratase [Candidatus Bilamarchaeum dharawalense]|uniref:Bifunctional chorismate mutase/prephenate dehydratase n=1 Tax=Candidatus Bilamarchaeum dharawalense TaxID=2885759 RepID=A0A5E4LVN8_9ARCH|nr:Prephenate dehydratase [Candidatus Bilamarchaeum dharawalense]
MELGELRKKIDLIDSEIVKLLNRRMEFALRTKKLKQQVTDASREEEVMNKVKKHRGLIKPEFTEKVYREILGESERLQEQNPKLVGFQGEHGAYSEVAVRELNRLWVAIPCAEFAEVFGGVANGQLDMGIVPVENSLGGAVTQVNDLLMETELKIIGEIKVPIHHCLLTLPETDYREIKVVYSHPQALSQCRGFVARNKLEPRPYYDTAGAAMMISNERPAAAAAIASKLCADIYGLEVLKENIEDHESNMTRFVLLSREKSVEKGDKCSIVFSTAHKSGALFNVLKVFSNAGINLTRIESRPITKDPGKFGFLLDFQGSDQDRKVTDAMDRVKKETAMFKFLGCYKEAKE